MSSGKDSSQEIRGLLEQRTQLEAWLEKLDSASDKPEQVREKVRADYQKRLDGVIDELSKHTSQLEASLEDARARLTQHQAEEATAREELAEAELRHSVGEYDEKTWNSMQKDISDRLESKTTAVKSVSSEISALEETLAAATAPPRVSQATAAPEVAEPDVPESVESASVPDPEPEPAIEADIPEPEPAPAPTPPAASSETGSVERRQPSAVTTRSVPSTPPTSPSQTDAFKSKEASPSGSTPRASKTAPAPAERRTLKCTECGKMNLPTEWYCEYCGAELAVL